VQCFLVHTASKYSNLTPSPYHRHGVWLVEGDKASHITITGQGCKVLGVDWSEW